MSDAASWIPGPTNPVLQKDEVHIWRVPLLRDAAELLQLRGILSPEETGRADRFHFERDRNAFIATRGSLRQLLARYLKRSPAELAFDYGAYGKPKLRQNSLEPSVQFNVSHSNNLALMAFSLERRLGIDVEFVRLDIATEEIAERYFSEQEVAELQSLPASLRAEGFFLCWTRKEAYVKAIGDGLQIPLKSFHVSVTPSQPERLESTDGAQWRLRSLRVDAGFAGAVVAEGRDWDLQYWDWIPNSNL
jgi:4'-phosphopantetheinyl transferase